MMDPEKVRALKEYKRPVKEMRSLLGLANYCRDYVLKLAETRN